MNNITKTFACPLGGNVRTIIIDGEPWFVGRDVAEKLGYSIPTKAIQDHVDDEDAKLLNYRGVSKMERPKIWQGKDFKDKVLINESGLYSLIFASNLEVAKQFKRWVTSEVLPQIRKTGGYQPADDECVMKLSDVQLVYDAIEMSINCINEQESLIINQHKVIEEQKPKAAFHDAVAESDSTVSVAEMAKQLEMNGIHMGQNRLFCWLRDNGYLGRRWGSPHYNVPLQKWVEQGIFRIETSCWVDNEGGEHVYHTARITGKGQRYFFELFTSMREAL